MSARRFGFPPAPRSSSRVCSRSGSQRFASSSSFVDLHRRCAMSSATPSTVPVGSRHEHELRNNGPPPQSACSDEKGGKRTKIGSLPNVRFCTSFPSFAQGDRSYERCWLFLGATLQVLRYRSAARICRSRLRSGRRSGSTVSRQTPSHALEHILASAKGRFGAGEGSSRMQAPELAVAGRMPIARHLSVYAG